MLRTIATLLTLSLLACGEQTNTPPDADKVADGAAAVDDKNTDAENTGKEQEAKDIPAPADVAAAPADATKTESGLAFKVLTKGQGTEAPLKAATVKVHYTGWTTDGEMFDSSRKRGFPASFGLNRVISGWTEGLQLMRVGDSYRFWIPEALAYQGRPGKPAGMLVFDVELLEVNNPPAAPDDVAAAPADATVTTSGLAYKILESGTEGDKPTEDSKVTVHYTGWTTDGEMFDSSRTSGRPATFPLNGVIAGWTEGLQLLNVGAKARLWIAEELAYKGMPGKPAGMLVFDVELLSFEAPIPAPADVTAPPADAKKTESGLAYKVIKAGSGDSHPAAESEVTVHYTGWTTDGKMFDSSVQKGQPATFPLNRVIAGWTEGLQLMQKGETTRFWIPQDLAYKGMPRKPEGMLVFDVELIDWK
jgi:peptidylprolyl isomerase